MTATSTARRRAVVLTAVVVVLAALVAIGFRAARTAAAEQAATERADHVDQQKAEASAALAQLIAQQHSASVRSALRSARIDASVTDLTAAEAVLTGSG